MPKQELQPISHHEVYRPRGEKLTDTFAGKHVRQYDSYDPRLVIDVLRDGKYFGKIIADNFTSFEQAAISLNRVEFARGHHKARLIFAIGQTVLDRDGILKHQVYSPEGLVGYATGDNLDFYLASFFYDDERIKAKAKEGNGSFDEKVQKYIEEELDIPGLFKS